MIPVRHTFRWYSHSFVGINNTSLFGHVFPKTAPGFSAAIFGVLQGIAAGIGISNFPRKFSWFEFFIFWFNEEDTSCLCRIFELWFLDCPLLLCFWFHQTCFHISGHTLSGLEVVCFLVNLSQTMCIHRAVSHSIQ